MGEDKTSPTPNLMENKYLFERKEYSRHPLFNSQRRLPTLDELATGKWGDVKKVLERNKKLRSIYRESTRGYTPNRNQRNIANYPIEVFRDPEMGKYLQPGQDAHERKKNLFLFLRKYPQFRAVDKI